MAESRFAFKCDKKQEASAVRRATTASLRGQAAKTKLQTRLHEGVDAHNGQVGLRLGIVYQIQIHQLLELQVVGLHAVDDVREQHADVLANRHGGYDLLDGVLALGPIHRPKILLVLMDLPYEQDALIHRCS